MCSFARESSHSCVCMQVLSIQHSIVHYDLKADNVLLKEAAAAEAGQLPFSVVIADFGETRKYASSESARTTRHVLWPAACPCKLLCLSCVAAATARCGALQAEQRKQPELQMCC